MNYSKKVKILKTIQSINFVPRDVDVFAIIAEKCNCQQWEAEEVDRYYYFENGKAIKHDNRARV